MKSVKTLFSLLLLLLSATMTSARGTTEEILTLIRLSLEKASREQLIASLGQPEKVEEKSRRTWWYYDQAEGNVSICWNNKENELERLSFKSGSTVKDTFDERISVNLQSGKTDLVQAVKLLGAPKSMLIRENRQEVHYLYHNSTLRLFFRDKILVDYALIGQAIQ